MAGSTTIEWTDASWNPTTGCTKISAGCKFCYAETFAERWRGVSGHPYEQGFDLKLWPDRLDAPLHWKKPRLVFVNSMSDVLHEKVSDSFIEQVFRVMKETPQHTYQVLTKRAVRLSGWYALHPEFCNLPNIWVGVSVENRRSGVPRIALLKTVRAAMRFVSAEPLLEDLGTLDLTGIDWVILGGESGPGARPMDLDWARSVVRQCKDRGVPLFLKQMGTVWSKANGFGSGKGNDPATWPEDLRVREMPGAFSAGGM
jgi:protein gp37